MPSSARSSGSASITMPGPPPYGRSSTVRYRSAVKSRGFHVVSEYSPASSARLVIPLPVIAANISGNSVTTSKRIISPASPVFRPFNMDPLFAQIHTPHHLRDPRNQSRPVAGHFHHVLRAVEHPLLHHAQDHALLVHDLEAHQVREVVVSCLRLGQRLALHEHLRSSQLLRRLRRFDARELREQRARV